MPYKDGICACDICKCGKHKCNHRSIVDIPMEDATTYSSAFVPKKFEKIKSCKPQAHMIQLDKPLSDQTTNRLDFVPHDCEPPERHKADAYVPPEGDMESVTMYRSDFTNKKIDVRKPFKFESQRRNPGKFDGENTYRRDFRPWDIPKRELAKSKDAYIPPTDPFSGMPTYRSDYIPHEINMVQSCKPVHSMLRSTAPLEDMTDYRQCFVPHPLQPRFVKEQPKWTEPQEPFEAMTISQRDYTPKKGGRLPSCKPTQTFMQSDKPLQSDTIARTDFINHNMPCPERYNPDPYVQPEGDIDLNTTYNKDFPTHPYCKQQPFTPKFKKKCVEPFDSRTDYSENFKKFEAAKRESMAPKNTFFVSDAPFETLSTTRAHFIPHALSRVESFKPKTSVTMSTKPLESNTVYNLDFPPREIEICPGAMLGSHHSTYSLVDEDSCGHRFYLPNEKSELSCAET